MIEMKYIEKVQWKINEHKDLINYGYEHSLIRDFLSKDYKGKNIMNGMNIQS